MDTRAVVLVGLGLVVGLVVGGVVGQASVGPTGGVSVPSTTAWSTTGCADEEPDAWVGQVDVVEFSVVEFQNYSFTHEERFVDVRSTLEERTDGAWVLAFRTEPDPDAGESEVPADCQPRTRLGASVALPGTFETLTVTLDGETLAVVEHTDRPQFRTLGNRTA
jgi:hypothetical protein